MNWSKTKTILIITFLFLNLFLTYQLIEKERLNTISLIPEVTIQERLKGNNITIEGEIPEVSSKDYHIIGKNVEISDALRGRLENQTAVFIDDEQKVIHSVLDEPYYLSEDQFGVDLRDFLTNFIISSAEYRYGSYEEEENEILLFQTYKEHTAYSNSYEPLILYLNEEREITGYQQRLNEFSRIGSENEVISYLKALEVLLNNQFLKMNDTITNIDYGYYSSIPLENEDLVYAPMWRIEIGENIYLVHAIESDVQQLSSAEEEEELEDIEEIIEGEDE